MSDITNPPETDPAVLSPDTTDATASGPAEAASGPAEAASVPDRNRRKLREGIVASSSMDKTIVVTVVERVRHSRYSKTVQRTERLYAHDENNDAKAGDKVRVAETRPLSKLKRWRLVEVVERAR